MDYNQCSVKWKNSEIGQPLKKLVKSIDANSEVGRVNENTPLSFSFLPSKHRFGDLQDDKH